MAITKLNEKDVPVVFTPAEAAVVRMGLRDLRKRPDALGSAVQDSWTAEAKVAMATLAAVEEGEPSADGGLSRSVTAWLADVEAARTDIAVALYNNARGRSDSAHWQSWLNLHPEKQEWFLSDADAVLALMTNG